MRTRQAKINTEPLPVCIQFVGAPGVSWWHVFGQISTTVHVGGELRKITAQTSAAGKIYETWFDISPLVP